MTKLDTILKHEILSLCFALKDIDLALNLIDELDETDFSDYGCKCIFLATKKFCSDSKNNSISSLAIQRELNEEVALKRLEEINGTVPDSSHVFEEIVAFLREQGKVRRIDSISLTPAKLAGQGYDSNHIISAMMQELLDVSYHSDKTSLYDAESVFDSTFDKLKSQDKNNGFSFGIKGLDDLTGGIKRKKLYVVAGRAGMSKTSFSLQAAYNIAFNNNLPVLFFSIEMGKEELMERLISSVTGIPYWKITKRMFSNADIEKIQKDKPKIKNLPLFINDSSGITLSQILSKTKAAKLRYGDVGAIIIDYLQIMKMPYSRGGGDNRVYMIGEITRSLKELAKDTNLAVILLSQVSRKVEDRENKRPTMGDLRESGNIEQDADLIVFPYRPFYYSQDTTEEKECEFIVAKNRSGKTGTVYGLCDLDYQIFTDKP